MLAMSDVVANEKDAISRQGARDALEKLAASLEQFDPAFGPDLIAHLKSLPAIPQFYGKLPPFPKKPTDPYESATSSGDMPTHDSVIEYEDSMMFYRQECAEFAKELAKAVREFSAGA
jgi:hypothetical protein